MDGLLQLKHEFQQLEKEINVNHYGCQVWEKLEIAYNKGVIEARREDARRGLTLFESPA